MAFDPDAYLAGSGAKPEKNRGFDPDAYLASEQRPLSPEATQMLADAKKPDVGPSRPLPKDEVKPALEALPAAREKLKPTALEAAGIGAGQMATFGTLDELGGVADAVNASVNKGSPSGFVDAYKRGRDSGRRAEKEVVESQPVAYGAGALGGALFNPVGAARTGAGRIIAGTGAGAAYGVGSSDAEDVGGVAKDAAIGAGAGAAFSAAGEAVGAGIKKVSGAVRDAVKRRILNEVGEGSAAVGGTGRKRLDKAGEPIVKEVISGPDAKAVRAAYTGDAEKGRKALAPIIDKVGKKTAGAYEEFEQAGRAVIDPAQYGGRLGVAYKEALDSGNSRLAQAIEAFGKRVADVGDKTEGLKLRQIRGLTTEAQGIASSTLGALNEHANAKVAKQLEAVVTRVMDETLSASAAGDARLEKAAAVIRKNNERMQALKTIDNALMLRMPKENTGKSWLVRGAERVAGPAAIGAAGGATVSEDKITGAAEGAILGGAARYAIPAAARAVDRKITTAAINLSKKKPPSATFSRALGALTARKASE